jgi:hypothetical protein
MYELISHQNLTSTATSITFNNIPQIYSDLYLVITPRGTSSNISDDLAVLINDSSSNFSYRSLTGWSSVAAYSGTNNFFGWTNGNNTSLSMHSSYTIQFTNYTSSSAKIITIDGVGPNYSSSNYLLNLIAHRWNPTVQSPITKITLNLNNSVNFAASTSATLYGINRTSGIGRAPLAMGGYMSYSNGYWVHTFPSSGSFIPFTNMEVEYLVIAGGGAGGAGWNAGGGGAGGYVEGSFAGTANTNYTVTIGAGGTGATANSFGANGSNSVIHTITANGGGGGAMGNGTTANGANGGSGGGGTNSGMSGTASGGTSTQTSPTGGIGYGNRGGNVISGFNGSGAGGGAGGTGSDTNGSGAGGDGRISAITGTPVIRAGGGGSSSPAGAGGSGGGGAGNQTTANGGNGTANTGSGGGGRGQPSANGGNGGSGIVIVRYRA